MTFDRDSYNAGYLKALKAVHDFTIILDEVPSDAHKQLIRSFIKRLIEGRE